MRKSRFWIVLSAVALVALAIAGCTAVPKGTVAEAQGISPTVSEGVQRLITVVGVGEVSLVPDVGQINVGVEARAATVSEAKAEVDRQMAALVDVLRTLGLDDKDIQTSQYSIHYEREPMVRESPEAGTGAFRVSSMLRLKVRDVEQVGNVLDAAVQADANQVYGVQFTVSDDTKWQSEAREAAMADARARAEELARLAGVTLGQVVSVSEVIGASPVPVYRAASEMAYGGGGIAPGELELGAQVQVTYAIQ